MSPEREKFARWLARRLLAVAGDASERVIAEERKALRDVRLSRPKIPMQREGRVIAQADKIINDILDLTAQGKTDSQIKRAIQRDYPMSDSTYFKLIDASSECAYPRNKSSV